MAVRTSTNLFRFFASFDNNVDVSQLFEQAR